MVKVVVPTFLNQNAIDELKVNKIEVIKSEMNTTKTIITDAFDADAIIANDFNFDQNLIDQLPKLKLIVRYGVGVDNVDLKYAKSKNIIVSHTPGANATAVAEFTLALILASLKEIPEYNNEVHADKFTRHFNFDSQLSNKVVGLVGYGAIAQEVESRLHAFGVKILISNRTKRNFKYGTFVPFEEIIKNSDIVSIHVPDTKDTHHLFNKSVFAQMKKSAILINTARGGIVKEADLIHALQTKNIAFAALDVFETEPLTKDSPLKILNNVILTPHVAGNTLNARENMSNMAVSEVINALIQNKEPLWQVN